MKKLTSHLFLSHVLILLISQCINSTIRVDNLIEQTCKETPNYDLCISSLQSDPRSSNSDVKELAIIMIDVIKDKATQTLNHINHLLNNSSSSQNIGVKQELNSCTRQYSTIVKIDVLEASQYLSKGLFKIAEENINNAGVQANSCEEGLSGGSILSDKNQFMNDLVAVVTAIIRSLYTKYS